MGDDELLYHPVLGDLARLLNESVVARVLYAGDTPAIDDLVRPIGGVRECTPDTAPLPTGIYRFRDHEHAWTFLVVWSERLRASPMSATWEAADDDPLISAYGWFQHWWDSATEIPAPQFSVDSLVLLSNSHEEGVVRRLRYTNGAWQYSVRAGSRTLEVSERRVAAPLVVDDPHEWVRNSPADSRRLAATLTRAKLSRQLSDTLYSFKATRTIFRAYQFKPVIRLLEAERPRLLIADEVGLGKTIEAGLVWTELDARQQAHRVLVVCPSALVPKWQYEMEERFGYDLTEATGPVLDDFLQRLEQDRLQGRLRLVCSLERLRTWSGLERAAELTPRFDLIIVDEAHALRNRGRRSFALGQHLTLWADAMVFLSATPLNLGNDDLYNLLDVLSPGEFANREDLEERLQPNKILNRLSATLLNAGVPNSERLEMLSALDNLSFGAPLTKRHEYRELREILEGSEVAPADAARGKRLINSMHALSTVITRTRKVDVLEDKVLRSPDLTAVRWTDAERRLYEAIDRWQRHRARRANIPVGFALQMPLRLASSCLPAARDRVLGSESVAGVGSLLWEEIDDPDLNDAELPKTDDDPPTLEVIEAARALGDTDSKFDEFVAKLLPIVAQGRRVLVFTFSRPVVAYLQRRLAEHVRVEALHGGIPKVERGPLIRRFREHQFDVLIASRVASEGLDFEFCSAVVNYDLPWNPMEVEQRIGRIDRFGQKEEKVFIFNFQTPGTIETDIVLRVMNRIGVFNDSIGELDPILRPLLPELKSTMFDFELTEAERDRRLAEIEAAIANQRNDLEEMESAAGFLASTDGAAIAGLEYDLESTGRYIGMQELVTLLEDWVSLGVGARLRRTRDNKAIEIQPTAELEPYLNEIRNVGERSMEEVDRLARQLRGEQPIVLAIDHEHARTSGYDLLAAHHPLVRAALKVRPDAEARFGAVRIRATAGASDISRGHYLTLIAVSSWNGVRPATELWTATIPLDGQGAADTPAVGNALLSALASGHFETSDADADAMDIERALARAEHFMMLRRDTEEERRRADNLATVELRRTSLRQSHERKVRQVRSAIETLRSSENTRMIALQESQITASERRLDEALRRLDASEGCSLALEHLAVCLLEVVDDD